MVGVTFEDYFKKLKDAKVPEQIEANTEQKKKEIGRSSDDCHTYD